MAILSEEKVKADEEVCPGCDQRVTQCLASRLTRCGCNHGSHAQGGFLKLCLKRQASVLFGHILEEVFLSALNICFTSGNVSIAATKQTFALGWEGRPYAASDVTRNSVIQETICWGAQIEGGIFAPQGKPRH